MAARTNTFVLSDRWKEKIQVGVIMDQLIKHVMGEIEMSSTQIAAAKILLSKVIPDMAAFKAELEANYSINITTAMVKFIGESDTGTVTEETGTLIQG